MAEDETDQISEDTNNEKFKKMKQQEDTQGSKSFTAEKDQKNAGDNKSSNDSDIQDFFGEENIEYLLFLFLILILVGNQNSFNDYFRLLNNQTREMKNLLNTFESTAEGLKTAIMTPQKMLNNN